MWAHEHGVPGKVVAELMGHAEVDTTLNVYTQVIDGARGLYPDAVHVARTRISASNSAHASARLATFSHGSSDDSHAADPGGATRTAS
jgi:integrase